MAKDIHVYIHGSSHFRNHHHNFQERLNEEWFRVEQTSQRQRFTQLHFDAVSGAKLDSAFCLKFRQDLQRYHDEGQAQVHIVCLGDNNLREAIDADKARGAYSEMQTIGHRVVQLADYARAVRDCYLVIMTPLPSPKYHKYNDMWERTTFVMRSKLTPAHSTTCVVRNITKCFWHPTSNVRGTLTGWQIPADLFSRDGVHLSVNGVKRLIGEIILALKVVPRFGFEREDLREIINRRR